MTAAERIMVDVKGGLAFFFLFLDRKIQGNCTFTPRYSQSRQLTLSHPQKHKQTKSSLQSACITCCCQSSPNQVIPHSILTSVEKIIDTPLIPFCIALSYCDTLDLFSHISHTALTHLCLLSCVRAEGCPSRVTRP